MLCASSGRDRQPADELTCSFAWTRRRRRRGWRSSTATAASASAPRRPRSGSRATCCRCARRRCARSSIAPAELAGIACGGGPGSFTGLRVGLSTVKGLALPTGVPLYVVSSLQALALDILAARDGAAVTAVPCLDAGKGEVYVAGYAPDGETLVRETAADCRIAATALADWLAALRGRRPPSPATAPSATPSPAASPSRDRPPSPSAASRCCSAAAARPRTSPPPFRSTAVRPTSPSRRRSRRSAFQQLLELAASR